MKGKNMYQNIRFIPNSMKYTRVWILGRHTTLIHFSGGKFFMKTKTQSCSFQNKRVFTCILIITDNLSKKKLCVLNWMTKTIT